MASLREIKDHIASVRSTLKITSAMKLVASAKLRKAQQAAEGIRPYTAALSKMLSAVMSQGVSPSLRPSAGADPSQQSWAPPVTATGGYGSERDRSLAAKNDRFKASISEGGNQVVAIVAVASNSSLCGAFNINVIHKVQEVVAECRAQGQDVVVFSVGRKMAEAMRKEGFVSPGDYTDLVGHNTFEKSAAFAQTLIDGYNAGRYSSILLIYNHFVNTASQKVYVETYLPFAMSGGGSPSETHATLGIVRGGTVSEANGGVERSETVSEGLPTSGQVEEDFILEPGREEILATLLPQVMRLRIHTVILDSIAAEHTARTIAMQTASDDAEDLLGELSLEYNKGRQAKITAEILDLVGGAQQ